MNFPLSDFTLSLQLPVRQLVAYSKYNTSKNLILVLSNDDLY